MNNVLLLIASIASLIPFGNSMTVTAHVKDDEGLGIANDRKLGGADGVSADENGPATAFVHSAHVFGGRAHVQDVGRACLPGDEQAHVFERGIVGARALDAAERRKLVFDDVQREAQSHPLTLYRIS